MANSNPQKQHLILAEQRTPEERSEIARKGAEATNKIRRRKKLMREAMLDLLNCPMDENWKDVVENNGMGFLLKALDDDMQAPFIASLYKSAVVDGNTKAMELLLSLIGEKPVEVIKQEVEVRKSPLDDLTSELFEDDK